MNEKPVLRFMSKPAYFANESLGFENGTLVSEKSEEGNIMLKLRQSYREEPKIPFLNRGTEEITMLHMICNQPEPLYQVRCIPESAYILSNRILTPKTAQKTVPVIEIEDSDEEVVFVDEYSKQDLKANNTKEKLLFPKEEDNPRRNPLRKARNSKFGRGSDDDNIYEEDFCLLDSTDDESSPNEAVPDSVTLKRENHRSLPLKNLEETLVKRQEVYSVAQRAGKSDLTSRDNRKRSKKPTNRKPLEKHVAKKCALGKKDAKGKLAKKRNSKVPLDSLRELIRTNHKNLSKFLTNLKAKSVQGTHLCRYHVVDSKNKENYSFPSNTSENAIVSCSTENTIHSSCLKNYECLMINQSRLFSIVNAISFEEALSELKQKNE